MPRTQLEAYPDTTAARQALAGFLEQHWKPHGQNDWQRRMRFWWDENPAAVDNPARGHWVHAQERLVCYGGSIPAFYAWQGRRQPALYATTLCVDEQYPKAAAVLFLHQRALSEHHVITHTTPNPRVQAALLKMGACSEQNVTRHYLPAGGASWLSRRSWWPAFPTDRRLVTNPAEITALARPYQRADRLEKWITPEYLGWFCRSPLRQHHFLGVADAGGVLTSYLLATPRKIKGLRSWDVVETFTTNEDCAELHALIGMLVRQPGILPGGAALVTAAVFPTDHVWDQTPAVLRRSQQVCHYFLMPEALRHAPKHTLMAEGDLGL